MLDDCSPVAELCCADHVANLQLDQIYAAAEAGAAGRALAERAGGADIGQEVVGAVRKARGGGAARLGLSRVSKGPQEVFAAGGEPTCGAG